MKKDLIKNPSLKILSLLSAFFLWLMILNIEDPPITGTFEGIPVTVTNENALESVDKVYDIISGEVVDVTVRGKRSIVESLSRSDFQAIADLSRLSDVNATGIQVSVQRYRDEIEITGQSLSTMKVSLENLVTEQFRIDIVERGEEAEGYYINEKTASPNLVQISAAESVIEKIEKVVVYVDVSNSNKTFTVTAKPEIRDRNNTVMDLDKMTLNHEEFDITVNLLETKTVKFFLELEGNPMPGYGYTNFEYEPKEVVIAGTKEELEKVPYISGSYNINNRKEDIEDEVNIVEFIQNEVILIDENQDAVVNISIQPLITRSFDFHTNEIDVRNIPDGKRVIFDEPGNQTIQINGIKDTIEQLNKNDLKPYIDLSDLRSNHGSINVKFNSQLSNLKFSNVTVDISLDDQE
jgi:YbbR domain-containing protein